MKKFKLQEKKTAKNTNLWKPNNMLLNNQWIIEEIKEEIKRCIKTNDNEDTTIQNLWDTTKEVWRGKFIAKYHTSEKKKKLEQPNLTP